MQKINRQTIAKSSFLVALSLALFSFSVPFGGDSIEIFLNKKLVLQQFVHNDPAPKSITLGQDDAAKQMEIYYRHCGVAGKARSISLKNLQNKTVKTWQFTDAKEKNASMVIRVQDLMNGVKKSDDRLHLYYTSKEIPNGKLLTDIIIENQTVVSR